MRLLPFSPSPRDQRAARRRRASSPFRYALPADNKADEIAAESLSRSPQRRRRDVVGLVGVKVQFGRTAREVEEASARHGDDDDASHHGRAFPAVTACARVSLATLWSNSRIGTKGDLGYSRAACGRARPRTNLLKSTEILFLSRTREKTFECGTLELPEEISDFQSFFRE